MKNSKENFRQSWATYAKDMNFFLVRDLIGRGKKNPRNDKAVAKIYRYLHEFCELSTFHGCKQLAARGRHWIEYFLWSAALIVAFAMTIIVSRYSWNRFQYFPTVIVIEKNNHEWSIVFPSATICSDKKVDRRKLDFLARRYEVDNKTAFIEFFESLSESTLVTFKYLPDYDEIPPEEYLNILIRAQKRFRYNISSTLTLEEEYLLPVFTEVGVCHSYNSKIAPFFNPLAFIGNISLAVDSADLHSITIYDDDSFASIIFERERMDPYNITISGPYELPSEGSSSLSNNYLNYKEIEVACLAIISTEEVRQLSVEQRNCRTRSDGSLRVSKIYSYNLCRMECRMNLAYELCGCVPYVYVTRGSQVKNENMPICDVKGMKCVGEYGTRISTLRDPKTKKKEPCHCHVLCTDFNFRVLSNQDYAWGDKRVKWQLASFPNARFKRTIIFGFSDMIVGIGSTAGLFLGCSVLSFVELIYFFTLRLAFIIYKRKFKKVQARNKNYRKTKQISVFELTN